MRLLSSALLAALVAACATTPMEPRPLLPSDFDFNFADLPVLTQVVPATREPELRGDE